MYDVASKLLCDYCDGTMGGMYSSFAPMGMGYAPTLMNSAIGFNNMNYMQNMNRNIAPNNNMNLGSDVFTKQNTSAVPKSQVQAPKPEPNFTMNDFKNEINGLNDGYIQADAKKNKVSFITKIKNFFAERKLKKIANQQ